MIRSFTVFLAALWVVTCAFGAESLLENFNTGSASYNNPYGTAMWKVYLGEDNPQSMTWNTTSPGRMRVVGDTDTGCGSTGCGIYWHFEPYPYTSPDGFAKYYIKSGTWDTLNNRLRYWMKCSRSQGRHSDFSGNSYVGTYVKAESGAAYGVQGQHYYHNLGFNVYANKWILIEINDRPSHVVGGPSNDNPDVDPEWTDPSYGQTHYMNGLTRWYWDTTGGDNWTGQVCEFDNFTFDREADEPDYWVAQISAQYTGTRYEVTFQGRKDVVKSYDVRYSTSSMKAAGNFLAGTSGGTVATSGTSYQSVYWDSSNMAEAPMMYVAIRPAGETLFSEIPIPQGGPDATGGGGSTPLVRRRPVSF